MELPDLEETYDYLVAQYGNRGNRASDFIKTAVALSRLEDTAFPRLAESIVYSLREALTELPKYVSVETIPFRESSRRVFEARTRLQAAMNEPIDEAAYRRLVSDLVGQINGLEETLDEQGIHQRRLELLIQRRTFADPVHGSKDLLTEYQEVVKGLNDGLHGDLDIHAARELLVRSVAMVDRVFSPPDVRLTRLDEIAAISTPTEDDARRVESIVVTPRDLQYFMKEAVSPEWLELLDVELLRPRPAPLTWAPALLINRLAASHSYYISEWLAGRVTAWADDSVAAQQLAAVAREVGTASKDSVLRLVDRHSSNSFVVYCTLGVMEGLADDDPYVYDLADRLLNPWVDQNYGHITEQVCACLVTDDAVRGIARLRLLVWKLKKWQQRDSRFSFYDLESIPFDRLTADRHDPWRYITLAIRTLLENLARTVDADEVIAVLRTLGDNPVAHNIISWFMARHPGVSTDRRLQYALEAISKRDATPGDVPLTTAIGPQDLQAAAPDIAQALGNAPATVDVARTLSSSSGRATVPDPWHRVWSWSPLLPEAALTSWREAILLMEGNFGRRTVQQLTSPAPRVTTGVSQTPITEDELRNLTPLDAAAQISAWRPSPSPFDMTSSRELARVMEKVVKENATVWARDSIAIIATLKQPVYVAHFFGGLAAGAMELVGHASSLVGAIEVVWTGPFEVEPLGDPTFDYDPDWYQAQSAGVDLIAALARSGADFGKRLDTAYSLVLERANDQSRSSSVLGNDDPLTAAINRPSTRAFEAMLMMMLADHRANRQPQSSAIDSLDEAITLDGQDGAEYRAILATHLHLLIAVVPEWLEGRRDQLFGSAAPGALGELTIDLVLKWSVPHRWFLDRYAREVFEAAHRRVERALSIVMLAMMDGIEGYTAAEVVANIKNHDDLVSDAGQQLAHLLNSPSTNDHRLQNAIQFWELALESVDSKDAWRGFGYMYLVSDYSEDDWLRMTLATCNASEGKIEWPSENAERAAKLSVSNDVLILMRLLLQGNEDIWEDALIAAPAIGVLRRSQELDVLAGERKKLRDTLLERGHHDARADGNDATATE